MKRERQAVLVLRRLEKNTIKARKYNVGIQEGSQGQNKNLLMIETLTGKEIYQVSQVQTTKIISKCLCNG